MSLDNLVQYSIDPIYECSKSKNGYPIQTKSSFYDSLDNLVKPESSKFDNCIPSTAPYNPKYEIKCSIGKLKITNLNGNFKIKGNATGISKGTILKYWAAAPNYCSYSVVGTGLPFPNAEIAYENTPNKGEIILDTNGSFEIYLKYPNGYYESQGEVYVPPHINFMFCNSKPQVIKIQLPIEAPFRSLGFNLNNHSREFQPVPYKKN